MLHETFHYIDGNWAIQSGAFKDLLEKSHKTLIFFYPKNDTPGCTLENKDFSCLVDSFAEHWVQLVAVSKDAIESHRDFRQKYKLPFIQISDPKLTLHHHFWAYGEKNNYGKIVSWVIRSTYLLDNTWVVLKTWKNVKAKGHAEKVLREL